MTHTSPLRDLGRLCRWARFGCGLLAIHAALPCEAADADRGLMEDAWSLVATLQFTDATQLFERAVLAAPDVREARLGEALLLLQAQPRTASNIETALRNLDALVGEQPRDRVAITAGFLAARVVQRHRDPADPVEAAQRFKRLAEEHPGETLGQMAWVRWALLALLNERVGQGTMASRLAGIERDSERLTLPVARRDFHLLLSMAYPQLAPNDEAMLRHLLAAEATGLLRWHTKRDVYIQIIETALMLRRHDVAQAFFNRFTNEYPRDERTQLVRERLNAAMEGGG